MRVLILGGTGEARALAAALTELADITFVSSLAGRVSRPALPVGDVRIGGFGGPDGLATYVTDLGIDAVVDATHPFAATITANAAQACGRTSTPLVVLRRPGWAQTATDDWTWVPDIATAAAAVAEHPAETVFLTTGRRDLAAFADDDRHSFVVRTVDPPDGQLPPRSTLLLARGPYTLDGERDLMKEHGVGLLVTKDSGGSMTVAKLAAARELGVPVIVVARPAVPVGVTTVATVDAAVDWLVRLRDTAAG